MNSFLPLHFFVLSIPTPAQSPRLRSWESKLRNSCEGNEELFHARQLMRWLAPTAMKRPRNVLRLIHGALIRCIPLS